MMRARPGTATGKNDAGQGLTEFALVIGLFLFVVGALMQFALILWSINNVTQVARDTARWAATQSVIPCDTASSRTSLAAKADSIALQLTLVGYQANSWSMATPVAATPDEGVGADWPIPGGPPVLFASDCPPTDNQTPWFVQVKVNHVVPIFLPLLQYVLPQCSSPGFCISSTTKVRMEPKAP
jgi:Flp pilus assembly protein TadG